MPVIQCTLGDCALLATLNRQLIEDEASDNPMNWAQLEQRMRDFLVGDYRAYFYVIEQEIVGYTLVRVTKTPKYLRQFFICREHRRRGYGKAFFGELMDALGDETIDIEVYAWNEAGSQFWQSLGFTPRSIAMRCQKEE